MAEAAVSQLPFYSSRPTIRVNEQDFERAGELLIAMHMQEQEGGLSALRLRFSNVASDPEGSADFAFEDESELSLGASIVVYAGDRNAPQEIFRGVITGLEADFPEREPPELLVLAEDPLQTARITRRTKTYEDMSIADLAREVASNLSLSPVINGFGDITSTWVQLNESDLAFLRRILRHYDGDLQVVTSELHVSPRRDVQRGELELALFSQLLSVKFIADLSHQVSTVTVSGWDAIRGERISASSSGANHGPGEGRSGAELLVDALGERSEHIGHILVSTDTEARQLADTVFDQRSRRFVCAHGRAEGNPGLRIGTHLRLTGVSSRFENTYYVVAACHQYDVRNGYQTTFEAECYSLGHA
ncbi:MAG: phage late control D family protein [Gammaproteobacteria bacterium]|nr:phage late control D family protein [Gammaproteobacteria bacterium]